MPGGGGGAPHVGPVIFVGSGGHSRDGFFALFLFTTSTLGSAGATYSFAQSSGTSGCGENVPSAYLPAERFVAQTGPELALDSARGGGHYLSAVANLLGCRAAAFPAFARHVQGRFAELYPDEPIAPEQWVGAVRRGIALEPELAAGCGAKA